MFIYHNNNSLKWFWKRSHSKMFFILLISNKTFCSIIYLSLFLKENCWLCIGAFLSLCLRQKNAPMSLSLHMCGGRGESTVRRKGKQHLFYGKIRFTFYIYIRILRMVCLQRLQEDNLSVVMDYFVGTRLMDITFNDLRLRQVEWRQHHNIG